jgi:hypothetical protein
MEDYEITDWFINLREYKDYVEAIGPYEPEDDYAGPRNNPLLSKLIPHTLYGIDLNIAFYQHDALYQIGYTKQARWQADITMLATGLFIIENTPNRWYLTGLNTARRHLARVRLIKYFEAVRFGGESSFNFR